jgi:3-deoxy-manno-octulosonate cytidylyltransferase (CMP-KDO synthetase)
MKQFEKKFVFIIPARMAASRFPGKPLKKLAGKPVVGWVYDNCIKSKYCKKAIIATDSKEIIDYCKSENKNFISTGAHNCASNRVAEVAKNIDGEWLVEVQGDEPLLWSTLIDSWLDKSLKVVNNKIDLFLSVAILQNSEATNPNFVKLIINDSKRLLWVSRSKIPSDWKGNNESTFYRHTGFHLWRKKSLINFAKINPSNFEISEDTHAVRIVENQFYAHTVLLQETQSIDIPEDLIAAERLIGNKNT